MIAWITTKVVWYAVGAVALVAAYWVWHNAVYNRGWNAAIAAIAAQDARAVSAAREAREKAQACFDQGREWDQVTGTCKEAEAEQ